MNQQIKNSYLCSVALRLKEEKWFQANFFMSFFSIAVNSLLCYIVYRAVFMNSAKVDANSITLYYIVVNITALSIAEAQKVTYNHMEEINSGAIISRLMRPYSYAVSKYLDTLALVVIRLCVNLIFIAAAFLIMRQNIRPAAILLGFLSVLLGFTILYLIQAVIGCFTVWFHDITRFRDVIYSLLLILGGRLIPSDLLYSGLKEVVYYTPLPYVYDVPVKVLMGDGEISMIGIQVLWIIILGAVYTYLFEVHVKHKIEFGG